MTKTKEIDRHGNVSYHIERDGQHVGTIHKMAGGRWKVFAAGPISGQITKNSIQAGIRWLDWYLTAAQK